MLAKEQRLGRSEFSRFFASGVRRHSVYFTLIYTPYPTLRGAVVVSKKVAKKAHERNTIRRRVYATLRSVATRSSLVGVYILIAKPAVAQLSRLKQHEAVAVLLGAQPK